MSDDEITRRSLLARGAGLGLSAALATRPALLPSSAAAAGAARRHALPSPRQVRAEFKKMVKFGPRLTASPAHSGYVSWLEGQFADAGLQILPRDNYTTDRWLAEKVGLSIGGAGAAKSVKVGA